MNLNEAYQIIDGMEWKLDGVHGILRLVKFHGMTDVEHHPSERGKRTKRYRETKKALGDDYTTTLDTFSKEMEKIFEEANKRFLKSQPVTITDKAILRTINETVESMPPGGYSQCLIDRLENIRYSLSADSFVDLLSYSNAAVTEEQEDNLMKLFVALLPMVDSAYLISLLMRNDEFRFSNSDFAFSIRERICVEIKKFLNVE